ncbi:hypothetical protein R6Y99_10135 [Pseudomonas lundensis]|uniref:hypothetical protein n=1 Tax=Serratia proteamaculans TaxID=28151 RepID=UPI00298107B8|nr:hypothetical protein [Serratia proteamaculans]MDW5500146.1 hypothetical protein [Serratia proteamaculans]MDW5505212.1 hypothetical protein [Pseudomonas lundensis]
MNITFTPEPIPELTISGVELAELGFGIGEPLQLTLRPDGLWITVVTYDALWEALCEASQHRPDSGADWITQTGELVIAGNWLIASGITDAAQREVTAAPGVIRLNLVKVP